MLPWLYGAVAAGYALLAFHPAWLVRRRGLRFTPDGFWLRRWALGRARRVHWAALRAVVPVGTGPDLLLFTSTEDRPEPLELHQYLNGSVLFDQLLAQAAAHGVALEEPEEYRDKSSHLQRTT